MGDTSTVERFDKPEFYSGDVHATFRRLRAEEPVFWYEEGQFWVLTKYDDIKHVSSHPQDFSSQGVAILSDLIDKRLGKEVDRAGARGAMFTDPPLHASLRKPVSARFSPRAVADMDDDVQRVISSIVEDLPDGEFDWMERVAEKVPVDVFSALMGLPHEDWHRVSSWATTIATVGAGQATDEDMAIILEEIGPYLWEQTVQRRESPTDDLLSLLTTAEINGEPFDDTQVVTWATTLLAAGSETTQSLIAGMAQILMSKPEILALVREDPSGSASVVEEALRWWTPVTSMAREVTHNLALRGVTLARGDGLLLLYPSANRDEERWGEDADEFAIGRKDASGHLGFGFGEHFCMGAHLARREARILLQELSLRCTEITPARPPQPRPSTLIHTFDTLPVTLTR